MHIAYFLLFIFFICVFLIMPISYHVSVCWVLLSCPLQLTREEVVGVRGGDINNEEAARVTVVTSTGVLLGVPWNDSATVGYVPTPGKPTSVAGIGDVYSSTMGCWDHSSKDK